MVKPKLNAMTTLYRATTYGSVEKIEAIRVTEASYFDLDYRRKERRNALVGTTFKAFTEQSDAIAWLREQLEKKIAEARAILVYRVKELDEFNAKYPQL
jgi:predicted nuclease with TOPRIM domain